MDSLSTILSNKDFDEPPEIEIIKKYIQDTYNRTVSVKVLRNSLIIQASSASLIASLRLRSPELKRHCQTEKRISFRIG